VGDTSATFGDFVMIDYQIGEPTIEGRYVIFTPCEAASAREYLEPYFATWHGGKWHWADPVWCWIGPLPVIHGGEILLKHDPYKIREYDL
jgi:hypothetical protein